jgi:transposase
MGRGRPRKNSAASVVKDIKRQTRKKYNAEERIRIVLEGLRGEDSISEICRKEGISPGLYYKWSKDFIEAGKKRLNGYTVRDANTSEVKELRDESQELKSVVAEQALEIRVLKKSLRGLE